MKRKTTKITGILLTFVMLVTMFGAFSLTASAADGDACVSTADCTGTYANGFCTVCDGYEPAALVTEENYTELGLSADYIGYYAITNAGNLYWFADKVDNDNANFGSANAVLTADIKISSKPSGTRHWNPIGSADAKYSGIFDGNGKAIGDIFAGDTTADMVGLVAWLTEDGVVKNVTVTGVRLNGNDTVGAIVAYNEGTVGLCGNTASVIGEGVSIGGIVGVNLGTVRNCWNTGRINGKDAGGIVGDNESGAKLENCWYTGKLDGTNVGGIVANNKAGATVENCYTTRETAIATAEGTASKVETKTADQFASGEVAYLLGGVWGQNIDNGETPQTVPALNGADVYYGYFNCHSTEAKYTNTAVSAEPVEHSYDNGFCSNELTDGTVCDAYEPAVLVTEDNYTELGLSADYVGYYAIGNAGQLYWFADKVDNENATYGSVNVVLTKDITVNEGAVTASSTGMRDWNPIGWFTDTSDDRAAFSGTFDGNGKSISGLYFNNKDINGVSLFAITRETALVKNVTVTNSYFCGYGNNSAVVAINYGTVSSCFNEATLIGYAQIGGIVGRNLGLVELCGNTGAITGDWGNVGGIVGDNKNTVRNCWNTGSIQADLNYVGGITGANNSVATDGTAALTENCWSTGTVVSFGRTTAGGIVGAAWVNLGGVRNCYSLMKPVGGTWNGHPVTNVETKTAEQFASGEVAYLLGTAWGQTLGANGDAYPVFATDTNKVYMYKTGLCSAIEYKYTNVETADSLTHDAGDTAAERFDSATGACSACGEFMAVASLTTADATPVVTYYTTLEAAITAAQNAKGSTVMLLDDVKLSTSLSIPADCVLILDLNGKTISNAEDVSFSRMIDVYGELTIGDSSANKDGKIVLSSGDSTSATVFTCNTLTVNNGTIANTAGGFAINAAIIGMALPGTSAPVGFLVVENGVFVGGVTVWNENFSIRGGDFELLAIYDRAPDASMLGERLTGGSFDRIVNGKPEEFTLADCLAKDVYAYGSDDKVITLADMTELTNVTVKQGADLSKDAVITVSESEYNGSEQTPTVIVTVGGVQLEYGVDYTVTVDGGAEARNAGEYPITVTGIGNYTGSANKTFTIEKATPKADDFSGAIPNDPTYDGTAKTAIIEAKSGIVGMGAITVKYYDANGSQLTGAPINAGTYTVKIDVAEGDNYEAVTDLEIGSFTIAKATPVVTAPTAIEDLIYNGAVQAIATPGSTTGGTLQYAVYRGVYDGVGVPEDVWEEIIRTGPDSETETRAGTYSVLYRVVGDDNYESVAMQYFTVTVGKAMPTLNVTSPTPSVLPGNTILLSYTLTGVKGEVLTNLAYIESAEVGNLVCDIDGLKVTVPSDAVIGGEDKLVVTLRSLADGNYDDSEVFTLTLEVGMANFTGAIAELEADIDELNELIANKADAATVNQKMNELLSKIEALEEVKDDYKDADATLKSELESAIATAKQQAIDAASSALDTAKAELNEAIAIKADKTALEQAVSTLNTAITNAETVAKAYADTQDAALKQQLESAIATAKSELEALIGGVQSELDTTKEKLDKAIEDLNKAITDGDKELSDEIAALNTALTNAKASLEKADADNKAELVSKIETADATLDAAIKAVQKNLDDAKAELDTAIKNGDTALDGKISNLNAALESAKAALEAADAANKTELEGKITSAQTTLQAAIDNVQTNLDNAKAELDKAIADLDAAMKQGDADLSTEIANLNTALMNAKAALEKADADNKAELVSKIETADATLDAAIKAVQKNLEEAQKALNKAIADGDTALDERITDLNTALETAKAALEATDAANKSELEGKITEAQTTLQSAIDKVAKDLADAEKELADAIASGDAALSSRISSVSASLSAAKTALEKADADNKAELIAKIEAAESTLDAAIKAVQKNLDDAKTALEKALSDGDKANADALAQAISDLNAAIDAAETAAATADGSLKTELTSKIDNADMALQAAIDALSTELDATNEKVGQLETFIIIVCVISGVALCGSGAFVVWFFIDKKKI